MTTKYCIECGAQIPANSKFCPHCGKPQEQDMLPSPQELIGIEINNMQILQQNGRHKKSALTWLDIQKIIVEPNEVSRINQMPINEMTALDIKKALKIGRRITIEDIEERIISKQKEPSPHTVGDFLLLLLLAIVSAFLIGIFSDSRDVVGKVFGHIFFSGFMVGVMGSFASCACIFGRALGKSRKLKQLRKIQRYLLEQQMINNS
jgi:hypothetical protein